MVAECGRDQVAHVGREHILSPDLKTLGPVAWVSARAVPKPKSWVKTTLLWATAQSMICRSGARGSPTDDQ